MSIKTIGASLVTASFQPVRTRDSDGDSAGVPTAQAAPQSAGHRYQLRRGLRGAIQSAFSRGSSNADAQKKLEARISSALDKLGVSATQKQSVLDGLKQIFEAGGSKQDMRKALNDLVVGILQNPATEDTSGAEAVPPPAAEPVVGAVGVDVTA